MSCWSLAGWTSGHCYSAMRTYHRDCFGFRRQEFLLADFVPFLFPDFVCRSRKRECVKWPATVVPGCVRGTASEEEELFARNPFHKGSCFHGGSIGHRHKIWNIFFTLNVQLNPILLLFIFRTVKFNVNNQMRATFSVCHMNVKKNIGR